jgi:TnpA family transposase
MKNSTSLPRAVSVRRDPTCLRDWSPEEYRRVFRPDPRFDPVLRYAKGTVNRIALFYHAVYLEAFGRVPPYAPIPEPLVDHLAEVLGEKTAPSPLPYPDSRRTFFHHSQKARKVLGWRPFSPPLRRALEHRLAAESRRSEDPDHLKMQLEKWLWEEKILNPGPTRVSRMVGQARSHARDWIAQMIVRSLTGSQIEALDGLRRGRAGTNRSALQWLKDPLGPPSPRTLEDILGRIVAVRGIGLAEAAFHKIHPDMRRRLRETVEVYHTDSLYTDFPAERRRALVACYLYERLQALIDFAVEAFDGIILGMNRRSEADLAQDERAKDPTKNRIVHMFKKMGRIMVNEAEVPDLLVRPCTYSALPRDVILDALEDADEVARPEDYNHFDYLAARYTYLRSFFPGFLAVMEFEGEPAARPVLEAVAALRDWNAKGQRKLPEAPPLAFVPAKWRPYVCPEDGKVDRHYWELCLATELHRALQAAEVWAVGGRRYGNVEDLLISPDTWSQVREECARELGLPLRPEGWLPGALDSLAAQIAATMRNLPVNPQTFLVNGRVHLKSLEASPESESLKKLKERVGPSWPQVRIQDLLVQVNSWTGFSEVFRTLRGHQGAERGNMNRGLLAALIAKGCNIGMVKMSVLTPGLSASVLRRADEMYLYEDALRHAYEALLRAHRDLPISQWLGDPGTSMSDGMRLATRVGTLRAALLPHAFAPGERALTYYWHVSHQGPAYGAQVIGHDRDAAYVLDQIFHIQSELPIHEHFTDTHGSTEVTFALSYLLGLEFSPRIKLIHDQDLYHPPGTEIAGPLKGHFNGPINAELIEAWWDEVLRVLASLKRGYTSAVLLTLRLSSYARQNPLYRALREVGRIYKSRFILKYYDDPPLRRKINTGLTRMENFNYLARHLFFARRGENWEREFEQQLNRASALVVLTNACVLWNAVHLSEVIQQLREEGFEPSREDFRHVSPYAHEHIVPYGEYHFDLRRRDRQDAYVNARQL